MNNIVDRIKRLLNLFGLELQRVGTNGEHCGRYLREQILESCKGVIHIGAHFGEEAKVYEKNGNKVIWFEAIPEVFDILNKNIGKYPNQRAHLACLGDRESVVDFHISNEEGQSSSIYELSENHSFPVQMISKRQLSMRRLDTILNDDEVKGYPHWVVDVQGAELQVLKGAGNLLNKAETLDVEVSSHTTYVGGTKLAELELFLKNMGFVPLWKFPPKSHGNLLFIRIRQES